MARPRSEGETREELLVIRVSRTELHEILGEVPMNMAISSWGRSVLLDKIRGTAYTIPTEADDLE